MTETRRVARELSLYLCMQSPRQIKNGGWITPSACVPGSSADVQFLYRRHLSSSSRMTSAEDIQHLDRPPRLRHPDPLTERRYVGTWPGTLKGGVRNVADGYHTFVSLEVPSSYKTSLSAAPHSIVPSYNSDGSWSLTGKRLVRGSLCHLHLMVGHVL